jgi:chorismate dehydratase
MIFGKIEYLNLLPFHVFMKRYLKSSQQQQILHYKRGVPSQINTAFKRRRVDAAFISSIASRRCRCLNLGIMARKEVKSVLLLPGKERDDKESATSNRLAKVLKLQGQVLIGDKALKHHLTHQDDAIDLAELWYERQHLPFVFARLCYHGKAEQYERLSAQFLRSAHKIPYYLLTKASQRTGIKPREILDYLTLIEYDLDRHALLGLKRFLRLSDALTKNAL